MFIKLNLSTVLFWKTLLKIAENGGFKAVALTFVISILIAADFKAEQIRIVSFIIMTSDGNNSVGILNQWDSFLPDISAYF